VVELRSRRQSLEIVLTVGCRAVLLALKLSGEIDITGAATLTLALVTVVLAFAAMRQAGLVRKQVQDARQPVLVPGGSSPSAAPHRSGGALLLPVANVGVAPALQTTGDVWVIGEGERIKARQPIPGLPAGATGELVFPAPFDRDVGFALEITTRDTARETHRTRAKWDPQHGFLDITTQPPEGKGSRR
jgi:hypothetical protein